MGLERSCRLQVSGVRRDGGCLRRLGFRAWRDQSQGLLHRRQSWTFRKCLGFGTLDERERDRGAALRRRCLPARSQREVLTMRRLKLYLAVAVTVVTAAAA